MKGDGAIEAALTVGEVTGVPAAGGAVADATEQIVPFSTKKAAAQNRIDIAKRPENLTAL